MAQLYKDGSSKILSNVEKSKKRNNVLIDKIEEKFNESMENSINTLLKKGIINYEDIEKLENKGIIIKKYKEEKNEFIIKPKDNSYQKEDSQEELEL